MSNLLGPLNDAITIGQQLSQPHRTREEEVVIERQHGDHGIRLRARVQMGQPNSQ